VEAFLERAGEIAGSGHRIVHGGARLRETALVNEALLREIGEESELAPLHNRHGLAALESVRRLRSELPAVACFDTAFHSTMPDAAALYAVPRDWSERFGIRRYGFHGLSHAFASRRSAELLEQPLSELRVVTCHIGAGASLAAVKGGRSVDTTMGFTPLEGLVMATRSGSIDPGALLWLVRGGRLSAAEVERTLEERSGLLGLSGSSGDMRALLEAMDAGDERAQLAIDVYLHRLRGCIAGMAAAMGGLDALVFTGGVGENSARIRARCCEPLGFLGVAVDEEANEAAAGDSDLTAPGAEGSVLVVRAREDLEIARETRRLLERRRLDHPPPDQR
jgi:acetate kinase